MPLVNGRHTASTGSIGSTEPKNTASTGGIKSVNTTASAGSMKYVKVSAVSAVQRAGMLQY